MKINPLFGPSTTILVPHTGNVFQWWPGYDVFKACFAQNVTVKIALCQLACWFMVFHSNWVALVTLLFACQATRTYCVACCVQQVIY